MSSWNDKNACRDSYYRRSKWDIGSTWGTEILENIRANPENFVILSLFKRRRGLIEWSLTQGYKYNDIPVVGMKCFLRIKITGEYSTNYVYGIADTTFKLIECTYGLAYTPHPKRSKAAKKPLIGVLRSRDGNLAFLEQYDNAGFRRGNVRDCLGIYEIESVLASIGKHAIATGTIISNNAISSLNEIVKDYHYAIVIRCKYSICGDDTNMDKAYAFPVTADSDVIPTKIGEWTISYTEDEEESE